MRILLSAFACAPNVGSETGGGWRWALELAREHEVFVLTDISRRAMIDPVIGTSDNPRIVYYRPAWLRRIPLNSRTAQLLYSAWQYCLLPFARRLHREHRFDLAIHLTYGVFRHPSFLGFLGIPFVFGPVGGGEDAPWRLKRSYPWRDKLASQARRLFNLSAKFNPFLWLALSRADLILVRTAETARALPPPFVGRAMEHQEIGTPAHGRCRPLLRRETGTPLEILFAGRLLCLKGIHLALRAVAQARASGADIRFTVIGSGPREAWLKGIATTLGLAEPALRWMAHVPQDHLFEMYETGHCLLFPSLHDSGGNVVLEALAFGLPVVCLDLGGPKTLVDAQCALIVDTHDRDEEAVVVALAGALQALAGDEERRFAMSQAALARARAMAWENRVGQAMRLIEAHGLAPTRVQEDAA
jgi:glycosyltransferase involved in cell wall biosynthesis